MASDMPGQLALSSQKREGILSMLTKPIPGLGLHGPDPLTAEAADIRYDPEEEAQSFARSLLTDEERALLDEELKETGFLEPEGLQRLLESENRARSENGIVFVDPEILVIADTRLNQCVFITPDNQVHSRENLMDHHPFEIMGTAPERVFAQQEVGIFPPSERSPNMPGMLARAVGATGDFVMLEDMIAKNLRKGHRRVRTPLRIVHTKIFLAGAGWEDFVLMSKFARTYRRFAVPQLAQGSGALALMFGGAGSPNLAIESNAQIREREAALAEREQRLAEYEDRLNALADKLLAPASAPLSSQKIPAHPQDSSAPAQLPQKTPVPAPLPQKTHAPAPLPQKTPVPAPLPQKTHASAPPPQDSSAPAQLPQKTHTSAPLPRKIHAPTQLPQKTPAPAQHPQKTPAPDHSDVDALLAML